MQMQKKWVFILCTITTVLLASIIAGPVMSSVEKPNYEIISSENDIEIRKYPPMIVAKVMAEGSRKDAISNGFRMLADYIFGNNTVQKKIAMTAPVQQEAIKNSWQVSFVMPSEYSMNNLPKPNKPQVILKEVPEQKFVVIQFSGFNSDSNISQNEKHLMQYIEENQIKTIGSPKYAFYNPPWTLPFMRRNEIMIEVD